MELVETTSQQAVVVSALTALPDLQQLAWWSVRRRGGQQWWLTDSMLLQKLTKLTALRLDDVKARALEHLGGLTRLQDLSIGAAADWAAAGCPGLRELKALTRLELSWAGFNDLPASVSQLTALRQLDVPRATPTALSKLSALTGLTQLRVFELVDLSSATPPLQLTGLQHFEVVDGDDDTIPISFLASCTQLQVLKLYDINLSPGSMVASTMLQRLELDGCGVSAADAAADDASWQQVFPGPGRLRHLTSLMMGNPYPDLQQADIECVVACCSSLQVLHLQTLPDNSASALACLPGLTSLTLRLGSGQQCSSLAQLTGLRELTVHDADEVFAAGLRPLAALEQLTRLELGFLPQSRPLLREHLSASVAELDEFGYVIINKAPAGQPPDVSAQLLRACDMSAAAAVGDS